MAVLFAASVASAGELDTASQCYVAISDGLGFPTVADLDTTTASYTYVRNALNAGLRAVEKAKPFTVQDTVVLADLTYHYTLNANLVEPEDGKPSGYRVERYEVQDPHLWGMKEATAGEFGTAVAAPSGLFRVEGNTLIVNSFNPVGDTLFIYGPGEITPVSFSGTVLSYPPDTRDRWAAVHYATWLIAVERSYDAVVRDAAAQRYYEIVGQYPKMEGQQ